MSHDGLASKSWCMSSTGTQYCRSPIGRMTAMTGPVTFSPRSGPLRTGILPFEWTKEDDPMKRSRFSDEQIIALLKENEAGARVGEICRRRGL